MAYRTAIIAGLAGALAFADASAAEAFERCPIPEDMEAAGVIVTFSDGSSVSYTRTGETVLEISSFVDPSRDFWLESWRGVYPLADGSMRGGIPDRGYFVSSSYPEPLEQLPSIESGAFWSGALEEVDSRGANLGQSSLSVKVGGLRPKMVGGCRYDAMQVETLFTGPEGGYQATVDYIPSLGIGVQTAGGALNALLEFYHPIEIAPIAP